MRRIDGFTLVELLVVIGIISVLAAILLPTMEQSIQSARIMSCGNQQRQLGVAMFLFLEDHRNRLPYIQGWNGFASNIICGGGYGTQVPSTYHNWYGHGQIYKAGYLPMDTLAHCPARTDHGVATTVRMTAVAGNIMGGYTSDYTLGYTCMGASNKPLRIGTSIDSWRTVPGTDPTDLPKWPVLTWSPTLEQYSRQWSHDPAGNVWGAVILFADAKSVYNPKGNGHLESNGVTGGANVCLVDGSFRHLSSAFGGMTANATNALPVGSVFGQSSNRWWVLTEERIRNR